MDKGAFPTAQQGSPDDVGQGIKLTRRELIDWVALCSCLALLVTSALLLANGTCSSPHGLSANFPVCVGGELSVQAWLAIVGIEFSVAGSVLLPRLLSVAISNSLTSKLTEKGVPLAILLNSLSSAPLWTQITKGWKKIALARIGVPLLAIAITVLYKFSFVLVNRQDMLLARADWVEMGTSPWVPGKFCQVLNSWSGDGSIFNNNYRDLVSGANNSILYRGSWAANATSGPATLYIGPGINATSVPQLRNGVVSRCVPAAYTKFRISTSTAPSTWSEAIAPFTKSVDLGAPQDPTGQYIKVIGTPDGALKILPVHNSSSGDRNPTFGVDYEFTVTVDIQDCWGNFTWNNALGYQVFQIQEPVDEFCTDRDMSSFISDLHPNHVYMQSIINAYFAGRLSYKYYQFAFFWDAKRAIELFLLALPMERPPPLPAAGSMTLSNPGMKALCDAHVTRYNDDGPCYYAPSQLAVIDGTIDSHGTGMTVLGLALQCFVLLLALVPLAVLLGHGLPLLTEWPAQWLWLAAEMPPREVAAAVAGTSLGTMYAKGQAEVVLASAPSEDTLRLRLTTRRG